MWIPISLLVLITTGEDETDEEKKKREEEEKKRLEGYIRYPRRCSHDVDLDGLEVRIRSYDDLSLKECGEKCDKELTCYSFEVFADYEAKKGQQHGYGEEIRTEGFCELSREFQDQFAHVCMDSLICDGAHVNTDLYVKNGTLPLHRYEKIPRKCIDGSYKIRDTYAVTVNHCAHACDATAACSSFSFYHEYGGKGAWEIPPAGKWAGVPYCGLFGRCEGKMDDCDGETWNLDAYYLKEPTQCAVEIKWVDRMDEGQANDAFIHFWSFLLANLLCA